MIACYCRVSSDTQKQDSQREEIKRWLTGHKMNLDSATWYEDTESGATLARPAFEKLQQAVFRGGVETLVVWKLDRISRDMRDGINLLADRIVASVLFGAAEIPRTQTRERQAAGIVVAKTKGVYQGRKQGTPKASPARERELREQGLKQGEIATALGVCDFPR